MDLGPVWADLEAILGDLGGVLGGFGGILHGSWGPWRIWGDFGGIVRILEGF